MLCELLSLRCICVYQYGRAWHLLQIDFRSICVWFALREAAVSQRSEHSANVLKPLHICRVFDEDVALHAMSAYLRCQETKSTHCKS